MNCYLKKHIEIDNHRIKNITEKINIANAKIISHSDIMDHKQRLQSKFRFITAVEHNNALIMAICDDLVQVVPKDLSLTSIALLSELSIGGVSDSENSIMTFVEKLQALSWAINVHLEELVKHDSKFRFELKVTLHMEAFNESKNF